ncbi:MAG: DNA alkylation repair protein [Minisyncoccia bacterium]
MKYSEVILAMQKKSSPKKAKASAWFFKTGKGQYGEGDIFIGLTVPEQRIIAKKFSDLPVNEIEKLLKSKIHEHRFTALIILDLLYQKSDKKIRSKIVDFYLSHTKYINNWDLVDTSASYILGEHLFKKKREILYKLARSKNLWERRIAIISTGYFISKNDFKDTIEISKLLLSDKQDLIHKAVGWMLREVGKRDEKVLVKFLDNFIKKMSRTTLRYAIERFPKKKRLYYLNIK